MICGLDFGTSNCSIGVWGKSAPRLVAIAKDSSYLPSKVYVERRQYKATEINEGVLQRRVAAAIGMENQRRARAKARGEAFQGLTDGQIEARERSLMRRELAQDAEQLYSRQSLGSALQTAEQILFGEEAIRANALAPLEGFYFTSPKLFLGSEIEQSHLDVFRNVISAMLAEVRGRAERNTRQALRQVVLGHPVFYSRTSGERGNRQALSIMESCARDAGFDDVAFLPEPLAAALGYEMSVAKEEVILVVDVGGGTTDCAVVRVGPNADAKQQRTDDVLAWAGDRVGGTNMDFHLAWQALMPHFGKDTEGRDGYPIPHSLLVDAISVANVPAQQRFSACGPQIKLLIESAREPEKIKRLYELWRQGVQFRLMRSAESAKIALSEKQEITLPLDYVDSELNVSIPRQTLRDAIETDIARIGELASEALSGASVTVDKVFVTGGASRSPAVVDSIQRALGKDVPLVRGDDFGSVTEGLTRFAKTSFQNARRS